MASGIIPFGNNTDHRMNQALNMLAQSRSLSVAGLGVGQAGLFAYNAGRLYVLNAGGTAFELIATNSDLLQGSTRAFIVDRANHTGQQAATTISGLTLAITAVRLDEHAAPTAPVAFNGQRITGLGDGTAGSDAATFGQLLQFMNNQSFKPAVRLATTANDTLSGLAIRDGVTPIALDRVLVKDQTVASANGIYVAAAGAWSRAEDFNTNAEAVPGSIVSVQEGTVGGDKLFMLATNGPIVLGTTALVFSPYGASSGEIGVAGAGLTKTGSTYDVGAGSGILVAVDSISIDPAVTARVVRNTVPAGASASINIVHGLALGVNQNIGRLTLIDRVSGDNIEFGWTRVDGNTVSTVLPAAPVVNQWDWTVVG